MSTAVHDALLAAFTLKNIPPDPTTFNVAPRYYVGFKIPTGGRNEDDHEHGGIEQPILDPAVAQQMLILASQIDAIRTYLGI